MTNFDSSAPTPAPRVRVVARQTDGGLRPWGEDDSLSGRLQLMQQVVNQAGILIDRWAPVRFAQGISTLDVMARASGTVDRLAIGLMALRDVPLAQRFVGMSGAERCLAEEFLRLLDFYLGCLGKAARRN